MPLEVIISFGYQKKAAALANIKLGQLNKKIGKDISLISFDTNVLESLAPDITTIRQPITKISNNLVKLIQSKMKNIDKNFHYLYKSKLVVKKSVKKLN